jgi:hypothetical protein
MSRTLDESFDAKFVSVDSYVNVLAIQVIDNGSLLLFIQY